MILPQKKDKGQIHFDAQQETEEALVEANLRTMPRIWKPFLREWMCLAVATPSWSMLVDDPLFVMISRL